MTEKDGRKLIEEELVKVNFVSLSEDERSNFVRDNLRHFVELFRKKYENVRIKIISDKEMLGIDFLVIVGDRYETQEELYFRLGINRENSWDVIYSKISGYSIDDSKEEMKKMLNEGKLTTPEIWFNDKKEKLKDTLNIGE